ncbi:hypothetical protein QAD02_013468 [Eretmocerus hayati]|uniref:Uncharacterized protein n=1 Tax=Eretmocerus hayati TaxID=131215 RepID=A0ACC2P4D2_9HYME|nr:hypothetical protein QAD02_013468 [Eretmocerus hayati]
MLFVKLGIIVVIGDMNARMGNKGGDGSKDEERNSRDGTVNREGLRLLEEIEKQGLMIVKRDIYGDREGGEIPEEWEAGKVIPIFQSGEKREVKNYHPLTISNEQILS